MVEQTALPTIEKGDVILLKDGRIVRVLAVYKPDGIIRRVEVVDDSSDSPMRTPVQSKDIARIMKKHEPPKEVKKDNIPAEQVVKEKIPVPDALKKDVEEREKQTTASALNAKHDQKVS